MVQSRFQHGAGLGFRHHPRYKSARDFPPKSGEPTGVQGSPSPPHPSRTPQIRTKAAEAAAAAGAARGAQRAGEALQEEASDTARSARERAVPRASASFSPGGGGGLLENRGTPLPPKSRKGLRLPGGTLAGFEAYGAEPLEGKLGEAQESLSIL